MTTDRRDGEEINRPFSKIDVPNEIRLVLTNIRNSIEHDSSWRRLADRDPLVRDTWKSVLLRLEEARLDLRAAINGPVQNKRRPSPINGPQIEKALRKVGALLTELMDGSAFNGMAVKTRYRKAFPFRTLKESVELETVGDAIIHIFSLVAAPNQALHTPTQNDIRTLRRVVPQQKVAPVQFSIQNGIISIVRQPAQPLKDDAENAQASRNGLLLSGGKLVEELQRSNCDRRLVQSVTELQKSLESCENIIQLGLMNIGVEEMGSAFEAELPDALRGMLQGHTRGVAMYVAQFPEWERFSEKAASVELTTEDISRVSETAKRLAVNLEQHPEIADEEVPKTIRALQQLIANPKLATKRAAFAVLRTIENLVAKTLEYCTDFFEKTAEKTVDCLSGAVSKAIVVSLMTLALSGALGISPLSAKITDTAWVRTAAEIVQKQIEALSAK